MRQQEATIEHLEQRLKAALQIARQGRPLSGSPLTPRVITAGSGSEGGSRGSAGPSDADLLRRVEELDGIATAGSLERAHLKQVVESREARIAELEEMLGGVQCELRQTVALNKSLKAEVSKLSQQLGKSPAKTAEEKTRKDLEERLSIQKDENAALRTMMKDSLAAKEAEITALHGLLESTKRVFSDGLRSYKSRLGLSGR